MSSRRNLYTFNLPAEYRSPGFNQLTIFDKPRELAKLTLHERINYRHNSKNFHPYDDHLYPYEQFVKAIRFGYSEGYIHQFTKSLK